MSKHYKSRQSRGVSSAPHGQVSRQLRRATHLLGQKKREEALQLLAEVAPSVKSDTERAKIANLVAKSQFELGRYEDAATRYAEAARLGAAESLDPQVYLAPALGRIRCQLKAQLLTEAMADAEALSTQVAEESAAYDQLLTKGAGKSGKMQSLTVPARPIRPAVALTRIGVTFLEEGYLGEGKAFLERVIAITPRGASRARQFLAHTLLLEGDHAGAEKLASESLDFGEFRAKTIPSWGTLIRSRKAQGKSLLDEDLYRKFRRSPVRGRAAARAELLIMVELRSHGDDAWLVLARRWQESPGLDPIVRVEVLKMLLSEVKSGALVNDGLPAAALTLAKEIFAEPTLAASECVGLAKSLGEYGSSAGLSDVEIDAWLDRFATRYGIDYGIRAAHACALGMRKAQNYVGARRVFERLIRQADRSSEDWGKAVWALAKLESSDGNPAAAARLYFDYAVNGAFAGQLRLQAFLRWVRESEEADNPIDIAEARAQIQQLLSSIEDYRPLLDAGRQLALAGPRFADVLDEVADAAEVRSLAAFQDAKTTQEALVVLLAFARRNFYDFNRKRRLLEVHECFSEDKLNWLWSHDSRYWEYLSIIMVAYFRTAQNEKGEFMGMGVVEDATIPVVGRVYLGIPFSEWLLQRGRRSEAVSMMELVVEQSPGHRLSSRGHYRLALYAYNQGEQDKAAQMLLRARKCLLPRPTLHWEWEIDAKSGLMLRMLNPGDDHIDLSLYSEDFLQRQKSALDQDTRSMVL
ncbi:tetratricopeptide repeat protein [Cerasicoccus maritimus]|uniref:tetratricopeptide repeat protein n=1 Tax=Cerasicoccus maritimus TaxID=490089 RepID=UPI0028527160|nr:hypothetical protein [Cerasicoccus maritimus]